MGKSPKPVHPGEIVRHEVLDVLELSVGEAAAALGVTRPALSAVLNGRASLSPEMAIRIEKAFGLEMERLLHLQTDWDVAQAKSRAGEIAVLAYRAGQKARRQGELFRSGTNAEPTLESASPTRRPT